MNRVGDVSVYLTVCTNRPLLFLSGDSNGVITDFTGTKFAPPPPSDMGPISGPGNSLREHGLDG